MFKYSETVELHNGESIGIEIEDKVAVVSIERSNLDLDKHCVYMNADDLWKAAALFDRAIKLVTANRGVL